MQEPKVLDPKSKSKTSENSYISRELKTL